MSFLKKWISALVWLAGVMSCLGQGADRDPRIGYIYPAGASRGATVEIFAGGRFVKSMKAVWISGSGVSGRIIETYRPPRNLNKGQRKMLKWRINCRLAELNDAPEPPKPELNEEEAMDAKLSNLPLLDQLDSLDPQQIKHWETWSQRKNGKQPSPQIREIVRVEIKVSKDAAPGMRELRFRGPQGLTNPVRFEVGMLDEVRECEPNEKASGAAARIPCTFNGQIQAGDVDRLLFHAKRGQKVVVKGEARSLIPYLADAVPGWFQMVLAVRDSKGRELGYGDCFRFDPDPVLFCEIPEDGDYEIEVRDSIYRGREDFVYRVHVGELPFVTASFPLGGREGEPLFAALRGWNLPGGRLRLDTDPGGKVIRTARVASRSAISNEVSYVVDTLPEAREAEPNNDFDQAGEVSFPCVMNGLIGKAGDSDVFRFEGRKGMALVVEIQARRLGSPLDSVVHVADAGGKILGWNDDSMEKDGHLHLGDGLLTHHADSRVRITLPSDGPFFVRVADTQLHGGPEYAYRLRVCDLRPDFDLRVTPSALQLKPSGNAPLQVRVLRRDGFEGEVRLALEGAPQGYRLSGARIPPGETMVRLTLSAPPGAGPGVFSPRMIGTSGSKGNEVRRQALAADDVMQAFLWRHLVEAEQWLVAVPEGGGKSPQITVRSELPVRVPVGGAAEVKLRVPRWIVKRGASLELVDAPPGISLSEVRPVKNGLAFHIKADAVASKSGSEMNLIIDVINNPPKSKNGKSGKQKRFRIAGLPAIPLFLTQPTTP
jgi:hypothetical protein